MSINLSWVKKDATGIFDKYPWRPITCWHPAQCCLQDADTHLENYFSLHSKPQWFHNLTFSTSYTKYTGQKKKKSIQVDWNIRYA